jgi:hypothetical protein
MLATSPDGGEVERVLNDDEVIAAIQRTARHSDGLVTVNEAAFALGMRGEQLQPTLRDMEARGLIVCTPRIGAVSVVAPTDAPDGVLGRDLG